MHVPEFLGGDGGWVGIIVAVVGLIGVLWVPIRSAVRTLRKMGQFVDDWNGRPERRDANTGEILQQAKPSAPALLERMRHQVENSHRTNLRDDIDDLARRVNASAEIMQALRNDLTVHVAIAKGQERRQARTAEKVDQLAAKWGNGSPTHPHHDA